jgi:hypothetical protein
MSPDLRLATIFVMPLGGKDIEAVLAAWIVTGATSAVRLRAPST